MVPGLVSAHFAVTGAIRCALLLCSTSAQTPSGIPNEYRAAWQALLHYWEKDGEWVSEVEDRSFFLDVEGRSNPEREWSADLRAFLVADSMGSGQHAQCRFPARFVLMKNAVGWSDKDVAHVDCPEFAAHERNLRATSLSVVFASHYLDNPASAFGHTMLYLGSNSDRIGMLADYSVSFEATIEGMSPLEYLPRGLFGGLIAGYRLAQLHERVRKYERNEQRDLWLFPLRVTQEEIDQLVRHLWELKDVTFRYGFFGGNCAQKILAVVHAVAPSYDVLPFRSLAVLPSEVARHLVQQIGLGGQPIRRPSQRSRYSHQVAVLTPEEKEQLKEMVALRTVVGGASPAVLSAALSWSEFQTPYRVFQRATETEDHPDLMWKRALWASRVANEATSDDGSTGSLPDPGPSLLQAHLPSRLTLRSGYRSGSGSVLGVGARWLLHGAVDPHVGYPPVSSLEVARVELGVSASSGKPFIDEATLLRVEKLARVTGLPSPIAWKVEVGARRMAYDGESPLHIGAEIGIGAGTALVRPPCAVVLYSMVGVRPGVALASGGSSFLTVGIWSSGLLVRLPADFRAQFSAAHSLSLGSLDGGEESFTGIVRKGLVQNWDVELALSSGPVASGLTIGVVSFH